MPRPKRTLHATAALTTTPPDTLPADHLIARVVKAIGNNLYNVELPSASASTSTTLLSPPPPTLAELNPRFRNTIYLKRGSYIVLDTSAFADRDNKLGGEIVNIVRSEKQWRKMGYWPAEFAKKKQEVDESGSEGEEESRVGMMPPSDHEEE